MQRIAAVVFRIDLHENVGIGPDVFGHDAFYRDGLFGVVSGISVMGEEREASGQKAKQQKGSGPEFGSHRILHTCDECTRETVFLHGSNGERGVTLLCRAGKSRATTR